MKINKLPRKYLVLSFFLTLTYFSQAQNATINGTVTDINNKLLNGVNIAVLGTSKGVSTDNTGNYTINGLNQRTYFLQVSYLGYQTITKEVTLDTTEKAVDFVLYQTSDELSEVVVTANRRLQNIQKTAASVSAVNTKKIEQLQVQEIAELNAIAPNFRVYDDGGTGSFSIVASRGISTVDFNPTVGLYIDDIPYFTTFAFPLVFSDLDNIEVLRGPQGTLYGRNALAGVIKINTKKPTNELTGFVNIGAGNLNAIDLSAGFNLPIVKDKLFFRASTTVSNRDGFVKNTLLDKDLQNRKAVDANFRLKYLATDNLNFDLHYSIQRRESDAYAFVLPTAANPDFGIEAITFQDIIDDNPYEVSYDLDVFRISTTENIALSGKYNFGNLSLSSVTAYQITTEDRADEFDFSPADAQSTRSTIDFSNITQEFRLTTSDDKKFDWTLGVFGYRNNNLSNSINRFGPDLAALGAPFDLLPLPIERPENSEIVQKGVAFYGQGDYELTDKLSLTLGLRYDLEESTADLFRAVSAFNPEPFELSVKADFNALSPKAALSYKANDDIFVYGSYARGFRPGGINSFVSEVVFILLVHKH